MKQAFGRFTIMPWRIKLNQKATLVFHNLSIKALAGLKEQKKTGALL